MDHPLVLGGSVSGGGFDRHVAHSGLTSLGLAPERDSGVNHYLQGKVVGVPTLVREKEARSPVLCSQLYFVLFAVFVG